MAEGGIHAGDPLIHKAITILNRYSFEGKETKSSGAKKGDGDIHVRLSDEIALALDGKYKLTTPKNPSVTGKELEKIIRQAASADKVGAIITNYSLDGTKERVIICMDFEHFLDILQTMRELP